MLSVLQVKAALGQSPAESVPVDTSSSPRSVGDFSSTTMDDEVSVCKESEQMHNGPDANKASTSCESGDGSSGATSRKPIQLTAEQKARIENNRQRALLLREKKRKNLTSNEYVCLSFPGQETVSNVKQCVQ